MIIKADDKCYWQRGIKNTDSNLDFTEETKDAALLLLTYLYEHNITDIQLMILNHINDIECEINFKKKCLVIIITDNYFYYLNKLDRFDPDRISFNYEQIIEYINGYFNIGKNNEKES